MPALDPATQQALAARMRFYRELGLTEFYRRPVDPALLAAAQVQSAREAEQDASPSTFTAKNTREDGTPFVSEKSPVSPVLGARPGAPNSLDNSTMTGARSFALPLEQTVGIDEPKPESAPADRETALRIIREEIGDCTRCDLHKGRNKIVFADGSPYARLMFVGEGPGADEDAQGLPFVGKAGQLLNNMIVAMGLKREEVYIANIVKCRPPGNRTPEPDEANTCSPFLFKQIDVVQPEVIVALGSTAATYLLGQRQPIAAWRGRIHGFRQSKLIVTYHPAFLLRDPRMKKEAWADLQIAMRELGLKVKGKE